MATGDTVPIPVQLETSAGVAATYADKTAFVAASWNLTFLDAAGDALATQPTWAIKSLGGGLHSITYTVPSGYYLAQITIPSGFVSNVYGWSSQGETYDNDSLGGALQSAAGQTLGETRTTGALEDLVNGDSLNYTITIPESALTRVGGASLTALLGATPTGITAAAKLNTDDSADDTADVPLTVAVVGDSSGARSVKVTLGAAALITAGVTLAAGETSLPYTIDVSLLNGTEKLTAAQVTFNLIWQADNQ